MQWLESRWYRTYTGSEGGFELGGGAGGGVHAKDLVGGGRRRWHPIFFQSAAATAVFLRPFAVGPKPSWITMVGSSSFDERSRRARARSRKQYISTVLGVEWSCREPRPSHSPEFCVLKGWEGSTTKAFLSEENGWLLGCFHPKPQIIGTH